MAETNDLKKLPFANYDIVVYFGVGVLSLPLLLGGVVKPLGIALPSLAVPLKNDFASTTIATLSALFGGYAAGHVLAFISSYLVEKFVHRTLGYPSELYIRQCDQDTQSIEFKISLGKFFTSAPMVIMGLFHLPMSPFYAVIYFTQSFGFYLPKTSRTLRAIVMRKLKKLRIPVSVNSQDRWTKVVEHYVANNCPAGYARMYNYLVIYGCMRSISLLCILYVWFYLLSGFTKFAWAPDGTVSSISVTTPKHILFFLIGYALVGAFSLFSVMSFAKFNRRYFEEALQAFCLASEKQEPKIEPIA